MENLFEQLGQYAAGDVYPYHMPGHKRRAWGALPRQLYEMDITEIEGFDNLHQPEGVLRELQRKAASLYGADESFYLVNGSTCGILCAVSCALPSGGHILMNRNCHKSAYHGAYLRNLKVSYLWPPYLEEYDVFDAVTPEQVRKALEQEPDIGAVLIVSPTYEGRIADVRAIAETVHRKGLPLIVDEAHGAHLGFGEEFPPNSCQAGADLVIHSVHKTLPAPTQTALLHIKGTRIDRALVRRFLHIYQTSSPSYLLMAGIDNALRYVELEGQKAFGRFARRYGEMLERLAGCRHLKFLRDMYGEREASGEKDPANQEGYSKEVGPVREKGCLKGAESSEGKGYLREGAETAGWRQEAVWEHRVYGQQDIGKLLISVKGTNMTGHQLYEVLLEQYRLQAEMAAESYVLAMFTVNDGEEAYDRMTDALLEIDKNLSGEQEKRYTAEQEKRYTAEKEKRHEAEREGRHSAKQELPLARAWDMPAEEVLLEESIGRYGGEFISLYPPGTPLLVPGERMTEQLCRRIRSAWEQGLTVQGIRIQENGMPARIGGNETQAGMLRTGRSSGSKADNGSGRSAAKIYVRVI